MTSSDRQGAGATYTLHRSDVHAQSEADANETKVRHLQRRTRRGQLIRRGRVQFKELGAPVDNGEIMKMTTTKIGKVQRMVQNMGTQHQEAVRKKGDGDRVAEYATSSDVKDNELLDGETPEQDHDADQAQQPHATVQHGLFGKDLPRCTGRDKATDGFRMLREFVRESESRVQQVKSQVPGTVYGLDYQVSMLNYLMPPRSEYPPASDKRAMSARGSPEAKEEEETAPPPAAPASARELRFAFEAASPPPEVSKEEPEIKPPPGPKPSGPPRPPALELHKLREADRKARHCPGRPAMPQAYHRKVYVSPVQNEMRPRPLPIRLPSLANFIAKSEPAMGGRSERGENSHIREMINELLGLDRDKVLKLDAQATQDQGGVRRGRTDMKRKIEKQLDTAWQDRSFLKKMITGAPGAEEGKTEPERAAGASDAPGAAGAEEAAGGGHDGSARRKREWTEAEESDAYAKFVALLREPDPTISPVARLRHTLKSYQEARDKNRGTLQSALYSMDADRLSSLKRRAQHLQLSSDGPDAKTSCALMRLEAERDMLVQHIQDRMKKQYLWYRDLWHHVRGDKRDLPKVAHFIFDFVRQVLEYGEEFQKDMYFAMLEQIEDYEFTAVIASLTVNMISGIEGVTNHDVVEWFRSNRGEVPSEVMELTGKEKDHLGEAPELGSPEGRSKPSLTFVTEVL